ncbi:hypothetical protein ACFLT9_08855 [Acidobacteriota bacterium]
MLTCRWIEFLLRILPLNLWRGFLVRSHVDKCPRCQAKLLSQDEARSLMVTEEDTGIQVDLWPRISGAVKRQGRRSAPLLLMRRRWGFSLAGAIVVVMAGIWILFNSFQGNVNPVEYAQEGFQIQYIKVRNQPAQAFHYQPADSKMIFVWAETEIKEEGYYE